MKEYFKDWFFWVDWIIIAFCGYLYIISIPTLQRWSWGYSSPELIATLLFLCIWGIIREHIINNRRWNKIQERMI